ncbi:hypothetical protein F5Y14DRAFT_145199 [Nemania sp. NC0429]|nr:hypothetical protein F5Y14DRAFT_145199 [Nemania sp. NC0429]
MAAGEIEEEFFQLFRESGEDASGKSEEELLEEAKEKTGDAIDKGFENLGIDLDNIPPGGEQGEVEQGMKEGKEATKDLSKVDPKETVDKWAKPKAFGKWVAIELAKGILFGVGTILVTEAWDAIKKANSNDATNKVLADAANKSSAAVKTVSDIVDEWHAWLSAHYVDRKKYGSITVQGNVEILRFEIFQVTVSDVDTERDETLIGVAATAKNSPSKDTLLALVKEEVVYTQLALKAGTDVRDNEPLMVKDGLLDHVDDLNTALRTLQAIVQGLSGIK